MQPDDYLTKVREQYENYPYPYRNPQDELKRLVTTISFMEHINFYCFAGKQTFNNNFRVLVAGGGTGDCVIFIAEQLRDKNAEIVYLDISKTSMEIAQKRAEIRKLSNIKWVHASILDLDKIDIGVFDYITCGGVLHHLKDPNDGLNKLAHVLKENGAIGVMVYSKHNRYGYSLMQNLMKELNEGEEDLQEQVNNCKIVLNSLSPIHLIKWNINQSDDIAEMGDIGIYDLLLHSQEWSYTVDDVYQWVQENCKLNLISFFHWGTMGTDLYTPGQYIKNPRLLARIEKMSARKQAAIAEILCPALTKHCFYISKKLKKIPNVREQNYIPYFAGRSLSQNFYQGFNDALKGIGEYKPSNVMNLTLDYPNLKIKITVQDTPNLRDIIFFFDGEHSVQDIVYNITRKNPKVTEGKLLVEIEQVFNCLNASNLVILRDKKAACFKDHEFYQKRFLDGCNNCSVIPTNN